MNLRFFVPLLTVLAATSCTAKEPAMNTAQIIDHMQDLATKNLGLKPIACVEVDQRSQPEVRCYTSTTSAEQFAEQVGELEHFRNTTGWRDDYGVLSATLRYGQNPQGIVVIFERPNGSWQVFPSTKPLAEAQAKGATGYVTIIVNETDD
ncbi:MULTISPECIES: hypothetical protein [unclassified Deinococcus]|uniref:hypothetical protein n=1 Tax=unclassified Deinococcus TaxID=2623546 RepID=UPI001C2F2201|nr:MULTISPECIES: hypothetical protein [unclassified Deinococcus]MDK2011867.1 hypothetical protein [Deinococcus sp. 43]